MLDSIFEKSLQKLPDIVNTEGASTQINNSQWRHTELADHDITTRKIVECAVLLLDISKASLLRNVK